MLLNEIKGQIIHPQYHRTLFPDDQPKRFKKVGSGIGAGIYDSKIYIDRRHPNQVLKVVPIVSKQDSYYQFLQMIKNHKNNPFFPRIYGMRLYEIERSIVPGDKFEGTSDKEIPEHLLLYVWMERLHPLTMFDEDHVRQLLSNIGIEYSGRLKNDLSLRRLFNVWSNRMHAASSSLIPQFEEAMNLLEPMFKSYQNDMHIENIMVRLTGSGPQLVLVDPLFPTFS